MIEDTQNNKSVRSQFYNYDFNKQNGLFKRWGETFSDDPILAPSPEILDIEISTICNGVGAPCPWCYKSNTGRGFNMSLDTFKAIHQRFPRLLTQVALGIGDIDGNPDLVKIMEYCRENDFNTVVPNLTTNGYDLNQKWASTLASLCGAVAVSNYKKDVCYDAVKRLTDAGLKQVNIHQLVTVETLPQILATLGDITTDTRLSNLNAIVFLSLKPKGKRNKLTPVNDAQFKEIVSICLEKEINFGFDSCSAGKFLKSIRGHKLYGAYNKLVEPCESSLFSAYVNVHGEFFPCSFSEGEPGWTKGIDVLRSEDFVADVWNHSNTLRFRSDLLSKCRNCPIHKI
jgi:sulfatase maturation enzyme AslB (radical SAM superfamily)